MAIHPGELLRDELKARRMTMTALSELTGRPIQTISEICCGKKGITAKTALELSQALGTTAELWMYLQVAYDLGKERTK